MAQVISKRRSDPRARTASDFDIEAKQSLPSRSSGFWQESTSSAKETDRATEIKRVNKFPISVGIAIFAAAVLGSGLTYTLVKSVVNPDDLKNQQYISSLQNSIVALKAENAKIETALQGSSVTLKAAKVKVEADKKALCGILSSARKSIAVAQAKCETSTKDVCSNLPVIRNSDIQSYCGEQTN